MVKKTAIIVTHSTEVFGPPNALSDYMKERHWDVIFIDHPLDYDPSRRSRLTIWQSGKSVVKKEYPNWLGFRPVNYLKDFLVTCFILLRYGRKTHVDYYFGFDSLAVIAGIWLRPYIKFQHLVGYNADYSTVRFDSPILNRIYLWADRYSMRRADTIWCVTQRIAKIRRQHRKPADVVVVPNGVKLENIAPAKKKENSLVFIGNLTKEKGIDLIIKALADTKDTALTVYGDGGERTNLEELSQRLGLTSRVTFAGQLDNQSILKLLPQYLAGVALYQPSQSYVYYSDPLKVKEYLAAGLPVIITRVPEIADVIEGAGAGVVIDSPEDFGKALGPVTARSESMKRAAKELAKQFGWDTIFSHAFNATEKRLNG